MLFLFIYNILFFFSVVWRGIFMELGDEGEMGLGEVCFRATLYHLY